MKSILKINQNLTKIPGAIFTKHLNAKSSY